MAAKRRKNASRQGKQRGPADGGDAEARKAVRALVAAAGAGRADLAWLDAAIRKAGYVKRGERATKAEVADAVKACAKVLEDVGLECSESCGNHFLDKAQKGLDRLAQLRA